MIELRGATVDVAARPGDDVSFRLVVLQASDGALADLSAATLAGTVDSQTLTVTQPAVGQLLVSASDTITTALGEGSWPWVITSTTAGVTSTVVTGSWTGSATGATSRAVVAVVMV